MIEEVQFDAGLESLWNNCLAVSRDRWPFLTFRWHLRYISAFDTHITVLADKDLSILVPLEIHDDSAHFAGGEEIADYLDAIGPERAKVQAWQGVISYLTSRGIKKLMLRNIPQNSETIHYFGTLTNATIAKEDTTPIAKLPSTWETYLETLDRKERHELKRKVRKFEEDFPNPIISTFNGKDVNIHSLLDLMKTDKSKHAFLTPQMEQFFLHLPHTAEDSLIQLTLAHQDKTLASMVGFKYNSAFLLYNSGFLREYAGAGFYLKAKTMQWAIEQGFSEFNFLQGSERYKYELGGKDWHVYSVEVIF